MGLVGAVGDAAGLAGFAVGGGLELASADGAGLGGVVGHLGGAVGDVVGGASALVDSGSGGGESDQTEAVVASGAGALSDLLLVIGIGGSGLESVFGPGVSVVAVGSEGLGGVAVGHDHIGGGGGGRGCSFLGEAEAVAHVAEVGDANLAVGGTGLEGHADSEGEDEELLDHRFLVLDYNFLKLLNLYEKNQLE